MLVCSLVLAAQSVTAQPVAPAAPPDEAREHYERGLNYLAQSLHHEAALELERSNRLRPLPVVTYNLALAYRGMGRYRTALEEFERYLRAPDPSAPPERIASIREEIVELRRQLVRVLPGVTPAEALVSIDGAEPRANPPPGEAIVLDPGAHVLEWRAPDHRPYRLSIPVSAAGTAIAPDVRLEPIHEARLIVEAVPVNARVVIDGRPLGAGHQELEMLPGEHHIELSAQGYVPVRRAVRVGSTGVVRLSITLDREPLPRWIVPTAIAGGVAVLAAAIAIPIVLLRPVIPDPQRGTWGNVGL